MAEANKTILRRTQFRHEKMGDVGGFEDFITMEQACEEVPGIEVQKGKLYRASKMIGVSLRMETTIQVKK